MATLEKLRNKAGLLVAIVIGLALVAFIMGDLFGPQMGMPRDMNIAEIGGRAISFQEYQRRVDHLMELNRAQTGQGAVDEQTAQRIREEVWNDLMREAIMRPRYSQLGLVVSSDELFDMIQGRNIHPIISQQFTNPQTGQLERQHIIRFLQHMERDPTGHQKLVWLYLENLIQKDRLFAKYNALIGRGISVTSLHAQRTVGDRARQVDFGFVVSRYEAIADSLVAFSPRDLRRYYRANRRDFEQEASRDIEYVVFPIVPSDEDRLMAQEWIHGITQEFAQATDAGQFVNLNSDTPFNRRFLRRDEIANPELAQWAFSAAVGDVLPPFYDEGAFRMARLVAQASRPDSVRARHILITARALPPDAARAKADSLLTVLQGGGDFAALAALHSEDPGSAAQGGDLGWFPEGAMVEAFNDAAFNSPVGQVTLVETQFGLHILEVMARGAHLPKVQVAILERRVEPSTQTYQAIFTQANQFAGVSTTRELFNRHAQEQGLARRAANNLRETDQQIAGLEQPREMIRWAYHADQGDVSPVFEIGPYFIVASLAQVREEGIAPLEQVRGQVEQGVIREHKAQQLKAQMAQAMTGAGSIAELGNALSSPVQQASRISFASFIIPGAGFEPALIGAATAAKEGELVGPIQGNAGVFALQVSAVSALEGAPPAEERERLVGMMQARAQHEVFQALRTEADVQDFRARFY